MQAASYMGLYVPGQPDEIAKAVRGITPTAPNELHAQMRRYPSVIMGHMTVVMRIDPPEAEWYITQEPPAGHGSFTYVICNHITGERLYIAYFD